MDRGSSSGVGKPPRSLRALCRADLWRRRVSLDLRSGDPVAWPREWEGKCGSPMGRLCGAASLRTLQRRSSPTSARILMTSAASRSSNSLITTSRSSEPGTGADACGEGCQDGDRRKRQPLPVACRGSAARRRSRAARRRAITWTRAYLSLWSSEPRPHKRPVTRLTARPNAEGADGEQSAHSTESGGEESSAPGNKRL